jgi:DNA-directed RNA polymerase subunit E'/Rpb7
MSTMFMPIKFNTTVILTPKEFNKKFDNTILLKIKSTLENNCSKHGFIKKDSIKIIKRTAGYFKEAHLNGNIAYDLSCIAEICNPTQDSIIKCVIKAKNNLGLRAIGTFEDMSILEVIIPRITSGIQSEINIDDVNIGDNVNVRVCGKKFTLYDKMISIVGKIIKDKQEIIEIAEDIEEDNQSDIEEQDEDDDFIEILNKDDEEEENEDDEDDDIKKIKIDEISLKEEEDDDDDDDDDDEEDEDDDEEGLDDLDEELEEDFEDDFEDI